MDANKVVVAEHGIWGLGGYEIVEIEEYQTRAAGGSYIYVTMMHTGNGLVYTHQLYSTLEMKVQAI